MSVINLCQRDCGLSTMTKFRCLRSPIVIFILLALLFSQLSCDTLEEGSVLYRILRKLKFRVTNISAEYPSRLNRYNALFLQDLNKILTETEIKKIQDFVRGGGTLIVSGGNHKTMEGLVAAYHLKLRNLTKRMEHAKRISDDPFFLKHPVDEIYPRTYYVIDTSERDIVILYGTENDAVVATLRDVEGRVFLTTSAYLFQENGLRHDDNAKLLYNLMSTLPRNARIGLAEEHYYTQETAPTNSFIAFVFKTPAGLAAVYLCLILFIFITLMGRRFGKPLDVQEKNRRLSTEYVHAMTTLYQKGNTRTDILRHIREKFRADLGARWRVNPNLDTNTFIEELVLRGVVDDDLELTNLIRDLDPSSEITEPILVELAKRVDAYREKTKIRRITS